MGDADWALQLLPVGSLARVPNQNGARVEQKLSRRSRSPGNTRLPFRYSLRIPLTPQSQMNTALPGEGLEGPSWLVSLQSRCILLTKTNAHCSLAAPRPVSELLFSPPMLTSEK